MDVILQSFESFGRLAWASSIYIRTTSYGLRAELAAN